MLDFGTISPIGSGCIQTRCSAHKLMNNLSARQERLLKALMEEIVQSTTQERPLDIQRLYPFSHQSAFQNPNETGAPLPTSPPIETFGVDVQNLGMPGIHTQMPPQPPNPGNQIPRNTWLGAPLSNEGNQSQSSGNTHSTSISYI